MAKGDQKGGSSLTDRLHRVGDPAITPEKPSHPELAAGQELIQHTLSASAELFHPHCSHSPPMLT